MMRNFLERVPGGRWTRVQMAIAVLLLLLLPFLAQSRWLRGGFEAMATLSLVLGFVGQSKLAWMGWKERSSWVVAAFGILMGLGGVMMRQALELLLGRELKGEGWEGYFLLSFCVCGMGIVFLPTVNEWKVRMHSMVRFQLDYFSQISGIAFLQLAVNFFPRIERIAAEGWRGNFLLAVTPLVTLLLSFATADAVVRKRQTGRQELALRLLALASIWNLMSDACYNVLALHDNGTVFSFRHWILVMVSLGTSMSSWMLSERDGDDYEAYRSTFFDQLILPQLLLLVPLLFLGVFWMTGMAQPGQVVIALLLTLVSVLVRLVLFATDAHKSLKLKEQALADLRSAQAHLVENGKLSALGSLVAGVAHELNTPLGNALTASSNMSAQLSGFRMRINGDTLSKAALEKFMHTLEQGFDIVGASLERSAELVRSFKQVAVEQTLEPSVYLHMHPFLEQVLRMTEHGRRPEHAMVLNCPEDLRVFLPRMTLVQILNQLLRNAQAHGLSEGVEGTIALNATVLDGGLVLEVVDDGEGMSPEILDKLFEPFFTTRRGRGNVGLGAHLVHSLVTRRLGGRIDVISSPGKGCSVRIELPGVVQE